jgi:hypothetical protein
MHLDKNTVKFISNEELVKSFKYHGIETGPINEWTRSVYEKKFIKLINNQHTNIVYTRDFEHFKKCNEYVNYSYTSINEIACGEESSKGN